MAQNQLIEQLNQLIPGHPIGEAILNYARTHGIDAIEYGRRALEELQRMPVTERAFGLASALSGGILTNSLQGAAAGWQAGVSTARGIHNALVSSDGSVSNLPSSTQMSAENTNESSSNERAMKVARTVGSTSASSSYGVSKETPVLNIQPRFGLQETHTCTLPVTFWLSAAGMDHSSPVRLQLRMNSCYAPVITAITTPTAGATVTKGMFNKIIPQRPGTLQFGGITQNYPTVYNGVVTPAWREYFDTLYDLYVVKECHWKVTLQNVQENGACEQLVGWGYDNFGTSSAGNVFPDTMNLTDALSLPDINWKIVENYNTNNGPEQIIIQDSWWPGKVKRNAKNDDDVKTWTATQTTPTDWTEALTMMFWKAPFNHNEGSLSGFKIQVQMKYVVQFKDLKVQARYPTASASSTLVQTLPTDALAAYS